MSGNVEDEGIVVISPPQKGRAQEAWARIDGIYAEMRRRGADPDKLADPVEILCQMRDGRGEERTMRINEPGGPQVHWV